MKNSIIFDLDGTLLDTSPGIFASIRHAAGIMNLGEINNIEKFIGPPIEWSAAELLKLNEDGCAEFVGLFREVYKNTHLLNAVIYPGIVELLEKLSADKFKCAVATYKRHDYADEIIERFGLSKFFACVCGSSPGTTKALLIEKCLRQLDSSPENAIYIGDTQLDREAANEAGVEFCGITWGFGYKEGEMPFDNTHKLYEYIAPRRN